MRDEKEKVKFICFDRLSEVRPHAYAIPTNATHSTKNRRQKIISFDQYCNAMFRNDVN